LISGGRKSRGAAKATSNVENVISCRKTKLIEKIYSGLTATDVELINGGKVINGYRVNRFTKRSNPSTYRSSQLPMSVMLGDILRCWHRVPLEKVGAISESKEILVYRVELVHVVLTQAPGQNPALSAFVQKRTRFQARWRAKASSSFSVTEECDLMSTGGPTRCGMVSH
jgi:hypothetical protein